MHSGRLGRRGAFLLLFGIMYVLTGAGLTFIPGIDARLSGLGWAAEAAPWLPFSPLLPFKVLWVACGVSAIIAAFKTRPRDWFGYSGLVLAPGIWGALFLIGVLVGAPIYGVLSTLIYWVFACAPVIVSGMQGDKDRDDRQVVL